jgi:hypothetical protein
MTSSVLIRPAGLVRAGSKLVRRLAVPAVTGAAALICRTVRQSRPTSAAVIADPAPAAPATPAPTAPSAVPSAPQVVVDPAPLPEPAVDLNVDVTLASELPIRRYDALSAADAVRAIGGLTDLDEIRTTLRFEEENAKREDVLAAARDHLQAMERNAPR